MDCACRDAYLSGGGEGVPAAQLQRVVLYRLLCLVVVGFSPVDFSCFSYHGVNSDAVQIVWRNYRDTVSSISVRDGAPEAPPALDVRPSTPSLPSLSGWLACWCEAGKAMRSGPGAEAVTGAVKPLWNGVTEGEKVCVPSLSVSHTPSYHLCSSLWPSS